MASWRELLRQGDHRDLGGLMSHSQTLSLSLSLCLSSRQRSLLTSLRALIHAALYKIEERNFTNSEESGMDACQINPRCELRL